jgi:hypothetical protein
MIVSFLSMKSPLHVPVWPQNIMGKNIHGEPVIEEPVVEELVHDVVVEEISQKSF